jgi:hypothetical protein
MFQNPPAPTPLARANSKLTFIYYNINHSSKGGEVYIKLEQNKSQQNIDVTKCSEESDQNGVLS